MNIFESQREAIFGTVAAAFILTTIGQGLFIWRNDAIQDSIIDTVAERTAEDVKWIRSELENRVTMERINMAAEINELLHNNFDERLDRLEARTE